VLLQWVLMPPVLLLRVLRLRVLLLLVLLLPVLLQWVLMLRVRMPRVHLQWVLMPLVPVLLEQRHKGLRLAWRVFPNQAYHGWTGSLLHLVWAAATNQRLISTKPFPKQSIQTGIKRLDACLFC